MALHNSGQLLQSGIRETIFTDVKLCKLCIVLDDLANHVHSLVTEGHFSQVQFASSDSFVIFDEEVKEAEHLLLGGVDDQVLALGDIELKQKLLLNAFDLGYMFHLIAKLTDVNLLDRNGLYGRAIRVRPT